jgi:hypothetical protein
MNDEARNELIKSIVQQVFTDIEANPELSKAFSRMISEIVVMTAAYAVDEAEKRLEQNGAE